MQQIGTVCAEQDDLERTDAWFARAITLLESRLGAEHPDLAARLDGMARVLALRRAWDPAARLLKRATAIFEKTLGPEHPNVAASLQNLPPAPARTGGAGRSATRPGVPVRPADG